MPATTRAKEKTKHLPTALELHVLRSQRSTGAKGVRPRGFSPHSLIWNENPLSNTMALVPYPLFLTQLQKQCYSSDMKNGHRTHEHRHVYYT